MDVEEDVLGSPSLTVPNSPCGLSDCKAAFEEEDLQCSNRTRRRRRRKRKERKKQKEKERKKEREKEEEEEQEQEEERKKEEHSQMIAELCRGGLSSPNLPPNGASLCAALPCYLL